MDEILIEEKKYVSSKRAAKITGYAKDYIGQLCREGRVPARLVGRSWYVLESAINDHRFGDQKTEQEIKEESSAPAGLASTWESPRYESVLGETIPSISRLTEEVEEKAVSAEDTKEEEQHLQDSWKAWFDRVADAEPTVDKQEGGEENPDMEEKAVNIPVHAIYRQPPEELLPRHHTQAEPRSDFREVKIRRGGGEGRMRVIQLAGVLLAVIIASFAVLGSGYLDTYILSNKQVGILAGVGLYNR